MAEADVRQIQAADWTVALGEIGAVREGLESIRQSIRILFLTIKGSDYWRPAFGIDLPSYVDRPLPVVLDELLPEVQDQFAIYEPRAKVTRIEGAGDTAGGFRLAITWSPTGSEVESDTFTETFVVLPTGEVIVEQVSQVLSVTVQNIPGVPVVGFDGGTAP